MPISINVASSGVTFNYGKSLFSSVVRDEVGQYTLVFKTPFARLPVANGQIVSTSANGGFASCSITATELTIRTYDSAYDPIEPCGVDVIILGYLVNEYDKYSGKLFPVKAPMLSPRLVVGQFSSAAVATIGSGDFTASKTATGTYEITFRRPFAQAPIIVGMGYDDATATVLTTYSKTANSCIIKVFGCVAAALADGSFSLFIVGSQGVGECGFDSLRQVLSTQRGARITGFGIDALSGTLFTVGGPTTGKDFSSASAADSNGTFNITDSFRRNSVFIATGEDAPARRSGGISSSTQIGIRAFDLAGDPADTNVEGIVVGFDDPSEYFSAS